MVCCSFPKFEANAVCLESHKRETNSTHSISYKFVLHPPEHHIFYLGKSCTVSIWSEQDKTVPSISEPNNLNVAIVNERWSQVSLLRHKRKKVCTLFYHHGKDIYECQDLHHVVSWDLVCPKDLALQKSWADSDIQWT